jgi:AAA+ ATPase superfamily predicted ATPase
LNNSFISAIIGRPGSGKTFLIRELLMNKDLYYKYFDYVYFFSPSTIEGLDLKEGSTIFNLLEIDKIYEIINKLNDKY